MEDRIVRLVNGYVNIYTAIWTEWIMRNQYQVDGSKSCMEFMV